MSIVSLKTTVKIHLEEVRFMSQQHRLQEIKKLLVDNPELSTSFLKNYFNVSLDTVRRDILKLASTGQATKIYGGVAATNMSGVPEYLTRTHILSTTKINMAKLAAQTISTPGLYFVGTSTTLVQMGEFIKQNGVTIITNSIDNVVAFIQNRNLKIEIIGGAVDNSNRYTYSMTALTEIKNLSFKKIYIGASAVNKHGAFVINENDATLMRNVIKQSQEVILVSAKYKFGNTSSPYKICDCSQINTLITDSFLTRTEAHWFNSNLKILKV